MPAMRSRTPRTSSRRSSSRTAENAGHFPLRPHCSRPSLRSGDRIDTILVWVVVVVALGFDFTNGFHDTANAVATSVSTRALSPRSAVLVAAVANLAGAFVTTAVAKTVGKGIIDTNLATERTVLAALLGAIAWNLLTWWLGLPSSSSHALIGGLIGAALAQSGSKGVAWHGVVHKVALPALASPALGFAGAFVLLILIYWVFVWLTPGLANRGFRLGQLASGTWVAFTHGANDAQKTMGVIALALFEAHKIDHFYIPTWVIVAAGLAIGAGTYVGGWRIMRTLGQRIFSMEPATGFAAQVSGGTVIYLATHFGYPVSTTHVVSGSVMGAGATKRLSAVRWGVAGTIVFSWVLALPPAALLPGGLFVPGLMERAINEINDLGPDIVVCSGDLTAMGFKHEYALAKTYLDRIDCESVVVVPGNHDSRNVGYVHFDEMFGSRNHVLRREGVTVVAVDSSEPDLDHGQIGRGRYPWIEEQFAEGAPELRIFVLHHHLLPVPGTGRERNIVYDAGDAIECLQRAGVDIVLSGHKHVPYAWRLEDLFVINAGTVSSQRLRGKTRPCYNLIEITDHHVDVWRKYPFHGQERIIQFSTQTRAYEKYTARIEDEVTSQS